jgi:hypothetical protein
VTQETAKALAEKLTELEEMVLQTKSKAPQDIFNFTPMLDNQFLYLMGIVESAQGMPTESSVARFNELAAEPSVIETRLVEVFNKDLEQFQNLVESTTRWRGFAVRDSARTGGSTHASCAPRRMRGNRRDRVRARAGRRD